MSLPEDVFIPLQQHIGAPCESLVEKGDLASIDYQLYGQQHELPTLKCPTQAIILMGSVPAAEVAVSHDTELVEEALGDFIFSSFSSPSWRKDP